MITANELEAGPDLDYWTGRAMGLDAFMMPHPRDPINNCWVRGEFGTARSYRPSTDKRQAFEVLETLNNLSIADSGMIVDQSEAAKNHVFAVHESLLVRICRCKVLLVFGNNLPIEKE